MVEILSIPFTCTHPSVWSVTVTVFLCLPYTVLLFSYSAFMQNTLYRSLHNFFAKMKPIFDDNFGPLRHKHCYWIGVMLLLWVTYPHNFCSHPPQCPQSEPPCHFVALQFCCGHIPSFCCQGSIPQCNGVWKEWKLVGITVVWTTGLWGAGVSQISRHVPFLNKCIGINKMIIHNLHLV